MELDAVDLAQHGLVEIRGFALPENTPVTERYHSIEPAVEKTQTVKADKEPGISRTRETHQQFDDLPTKPDIER